MRDDTVAEEGRSAPACAIDQLIADHHVQWFDVLTQAAYGADRQDERNPKLLEGVDVSARGNPGREDAVTHAATRQEGNWLARHRPDDEASARQPEGSLDARLYD